MGLKGFSTSNYLYHSGDPLGTNYTAWGMSCWFYLPSGLGNHYGVFLTRGYTTDNLRRYVRYRQTSTNLVLGGSDYWTDSEDSGKTWSVNCDLALRDRWNHMAYTINGSTRYVALNGELIATLTGATVGTMAPTYMSIGADRYGAAGTVVSPILGSLSDFRIYNRALAVGEMTSLYGARGNDSILRGLILRTAVKNGATGATQTGGTVKDLSKLRTISVIGTTTFADDPIGAARKAA